MDAPPIESSDSRDSRLKSRLWPWKRQLPGLPRSGLRRSNVRGKLQPKLSIWKLRPDRLGFLDEFLWVEGVVDWWWLLATGIKPKIGCLVHLNAVKTKNPLKGLKGYPKKTRNALSCFISREQLDFGGYGDLLSLLNIHVFAQNVQKQGTPKSKVYHSLSMFIMFFDRRS